MPAEVMQDPANRERCEPRHFSRQKVCQNKFNDYCRHAGFDKLVRGAHPPRNKRSDLITWTDYAKMAKAAEIVGVAQNAIREWAAQETIPMR